LCNYSISSLGLDEIERPVFGNACARDTLLFLMGTIHESYQSENQTKQWYNEISGSGE
jgi:hypothetical protein